MNFFALINPLSALLLFLMALVVLLKERKAVSLTLAAGLLLLAVIQVLDPLALGEASGSLGQKRLVLFLKSLMPVAFLLYGLAYRKRSVAQHSFLPFAVPVLIGAAFGASALVLPLELFFTRTELPPGAMLPLDKVGYWYYLGLMIFCIAALANLEAVFLAIRGADRWRVKYEFLGVGVILGVFIFYFSQGLLYRSVNVSLLPVRSTVLVVASILIGYSLLFRGRSQKVVVSRYVFYRSFTLLAVGIYLIALGLIGQVLRSLNITLGRNQVVLAAFLGGIAFLILVFSEEIRRRVKVLTAKHFFAHKHDYREQWLSFSNALAACHGLREVQEMIVGTYCTTFGLRYAALYLRGGSDELFIIGAANGREDLPKSFAISQGLHGYYAQTGRVLNPADGEYTPTPEEKTFLDQTGAWLVVPLISGDRLDAVALFGRQIATERLTYEDYDLMKIVGRQAALSLSNFRLSEELAESREMAAVAKVSSFVIHDLKNLAYTFSLMMENAEEHIGEADFQQDLVKSIRGTVAKMNALIAKLKAFPQKRELQAETTDLGVIAGATLEELRQVKPRVQFIDECAPAVVSADVQELRKVVLNLLINACDALGEQGRVALSTGERDGEVFVRVEDNGCGMSQAFVESQLFRPFRTTKEKGLGIGLYQCKQIVEAHGGRIEVESRAEKGTVFTVRLPRQDDLR